MTGFTQWLQNVLRLKAKEEPWQEHSKSRIKLQLLLPARFKLDVRNERIIGALP